MGLRGWVRRLEHAARGNLESFPIEDMSEYPLVASLTALDGPRPGDTAKQG
jgi:hypothetical protein